MAYPQGRSPDLALSSAPGLPHRSAPVPSRQTARIAHAICGRNSRTGSSSTPSDACHQLTGHPMSATRRAAAIPARHTVRTAQRILGGRLAPGSRRPQGDQHDTAVPGLHHLALCSAFAAVVAGGNSRRYPHGNDR